MPAGEGRSRRKRVREERGKVVGLSIEIPVLLALSGSRDRPLGSATSLTFLYCPHQEADPPPGFSAHRSVVWAVVLTHRRAEPVLGKVAYQHTGPGRLAEADSHFISWFYKHKPLLSFCTLPAIFLLTCRCSLYGGDCLFLYHLQLQYCVNLPCSQ